MRVALSSIVPIPLLAACVAPTPGAVRQVPDPVSTRYINPGTLAALPGFTHAVRIGPTLYVSGEVALDSTGRLVGPGDLGAQAAQAFANLATVLRIGGATPADVAKLTIFVVNFSPQDMERIRQAAPDFFPPRNPPAGNGVWGAALAPGGVVVGGGATAGGGGKNFPPPPRPER